MTDQPTPPPAAPPPPVKQKRQRPPSRPQRWADAVSKADEALSNLESAQGELVEALQELREVQEEYEQWKDNLPENLASSALGEKLEAICDLQIDGAGDEVESAISSARDVVGEAEGVELPRGFGKD